MPSSSTSGGVGVSGSGEHRNGKTGALIWSGHTRGKWWLYFFGDWDTWRSNYCEKHRDKKLPQSFRRGELAPLSILATIWLKMGK